MTSETSRVRSAGQRVSAFVAGLAVAGLLATGGTGAPQSAFADSEEPAATAAVTPAPTPATADSEPMSPPVADGDTPTPMPAQGDLSVGSEARVNPIPTETVPLSTASSRRDAGAHRSTKSGSLSGRIRSETGEIVAEARVKVRRTTGAKETIGLVTVTDGRYSFEGIAPGRYTISFTPDANSGLLVQKLTVHVAAGATTKTDASLRIGATVTGRLTFRDGSPANKIRVVVQMANGKNRATVSRPNGEYTEAGIVEGPTRVVVANSAAYVAQARKFEASLGTTSTLDISIPRAGVVTGVVTSAETGEPIEGLIMSGAKPRGGSKTIYTDAQGRYTFPYAPPGTRTVTASPGRKHLPSDPVQNFLAGSSTVSVPADTTTVVDLSLQPGSAVSGVLADKNGKPYGGYAVEAGKFTASGAWTTYRWIVADSIGGYTLAGLPADTYTVVLKLCSTPRALCAHTIGESTISPVSPGTVNFSSDVSFASTPRPTIAGIPRQGKTLRAEMKTWIPAPYEVDYRWYRDGRPIGGATSPTYSVKAKDVGTRLSVKYSARRPHFAPASRMAISIRVAAATR